jgi:thiosulfate dehydrogenase
MTGIWGQFPQYRAREGMVDILEERINGCMQRSMNGRALSLESREMKAFSSYMRWLSTGVADGAKLVGAGTLQIKEPGRAADLSRGAETYAQVCAACHGADGLGQRAQHGLGYQFPPLWGSDSYNNGAGMARLLTVAAYAMHNMPLGTTFNAPVLTDKQAYDVAGYIVTRDRPKKGEPRRGFSDSSSKANRHSIRSLCGRLSRRAAPIGSVRSNPGQGERASKRIQNGARGRA